MSNAVPSNASNNMEGPIDLVNARAVRFSSPSNYLGYLPRGSPIIMCQEAAGFENPTTDPNPLYDVFTAQQGGITREDSDGRFRGSDDCFLAEALTRVGSRRLQELLEARHPAITRMIFRDSYSTLFYLMTDLHGGYVLTALIFFFEGTTALIEACNERQLKLILLKICRNRELFIMAALTRYGCATIKRLIKLLRRSSLVSLLVFILAGGYRKLMVHPVGRFAVIDCVKVLKPEQVEPIYQQATRYCLELAGDKEGCISLNEMIIHSQGRCRDIDIVSFHAVYLSYHPSGSYVVQNVVEKGSPGHVREIGCRLVGHYEKLSMMRNGSHLVEKCLKSAATEYVAEDLARSKQLLRIARDEYGNYVVQTALKATKMGRSPVHDRLVERIRQEGKGLDSAYGKNVQRLILGGIPVDKC